MDMEYYSMKDKEMAYKTSDMTLMVKASDLLKDAGYSQIREKYRLRNPRKYVSAETHRTIMQEAIDIAKQLISRGGTEDETRNACLYLYICLDARKYRLNHQKARKDLHIDEVCRKYEIKVSEPVY